MDRHYAKSWSHKQTKMLTNENVEIQTFFGQNMNVKMEFVGKWLTIKASTLELLIQTCWKSTFLENNFISINNIQDQYIHQLQILFLACSSGPNINK